METNSTVTQRRLPLHSRYVNVSMIEHEGWLLPRAFGPLRTETSLLADGRAFVDFSDRGVLKIEGNDARDWFHRMSTSDFTDFTEANPLQTALLTEKGRIIDSVVVFRRDGIVWVITSRGASGTVLQWMEKYVIMEDLRISDETGDHTVLVKLDPRLNTRDSARETVGPSPVRIRFFGVNASFYFDGESEDLSSSVQVGLDAYEAFRIRHGIPEYGKEILGDFNPLELGLWDQISFRKGCYVGQEVIARLDTYNKVQKNLCRVRFKGGHSWKTSRLLSADGDSVGKVTSAIADSEDHQSSVGLAVVKSGYADLGQTLLFDDGSTVSIEKVFGGRGEE